MSSLPENLKNEFTAAFEIFTKDSENQDLGLDELSSVLKMLGQDASEDEVKDIMKENSESGSMNLDEFLDFMGRQIAAQMPEKREEDLSKEFKSLLHDVFRWYDKDADGFIGIEELKTAMLATGEKIEDWEVNEMMAEADGNGDNRMDFDEWLGLMKDVEGMV